MGRPFPFRGVPGFRDLANRPWAAAPLRRAARLHRAVTAPRPRGLWVGPALAWRTLREVRNDRVYGLAAEAAFWALLSLPALALTSLGIVGLVGELLGPGALREIQDALMNAGGLLLTPTARERLVQPLVDRMLSGGPDNLVSLGFVVALWSGSAAMSRYVSTVTVAYDMEGLRSLWRTRLLAFWLNLGGLALGIVLLPVLVLGPDAVVGLAPGAVTPATAALVGPAFWTAVVVLAVIALTTLYHAGVPVRTPWYRDVPGAVLALALWAGGTLALHAYLTSGLRNTEFAALAAPIAVLLFLYVAAFAVLMGAELNSEIDELWPVASTVEGRERARARAEAGMLSRLERHSTTSEADGGGA